MNKIFKLTMLSIMCFMLLTGCKNESESKDNTLPDVADTEQAEVDEQETNIENATQTETESANSTPERKGPKLKADDAHKFFYGIWEYTDVVSQDSWSAGVDAKDIIGTQVAYSPDIYICNENVIRYPIYLIDIFPQDPDPYIFGQLDNLEEILPGAKYYTWIQIVNKDWVDSEVEREYLGDGFLLKDENTMYVFEYNYIFELKRVGGVEDINTDNIPEDKGMPQVPLDRVYTQYTQEDAYRMFFGRWRYKKIVWEQKDQQDDQASEDLLGTEVFYDSGRYGWTQTDDDIDSQTDDDIDSQADDGIDKQTSGFKIYLFSENEDDYSSFLESDLQIDMKELVPNEPYYICIKVCNMVRDKKDRGRKLILKNDNTMYAIENNCIYELERIRYVDGYDPMEIISYNYRY